MYDHHLCLFFHSDSDASKTWFLTTTTVSSGNENRWPRIVFLMCGNKMKSLGAKSALYGGWPINSTFWPVNKGLLKGPNSFLGNFLSLFGTFPVMSRQSNHECWLSVSLEFEDCPRILLLFALKGFNWNSNLNLPSYNNRLKLLNIPPLSCRSLVSFLWLN